MMNEYSGQDLDLELRDKLRLLDMSLREYGKRGRTYAQAEHDYRVAMAKQVLIERNNGQPVTIISEVDYKAVQEAINSYKLQIKILEAQRAREWSG